MENKTTIIIATHKKYKMPSDKMYLPVYVGAEGKKNSDGKDLDLGQHRIYRDKEKAHPSLKLNTHRYVQFSSAGRTESSRQGFPVSQIQIRQCEHDIQFGGLFSQTPISCFSISE